MKRALVSLALIINFLLPQPASAAVTITEIDSAPYPSALAVDDDDNIFIGDSNNPNTALQGLVVIPSSSGTMFGQSVTASTRKLLVPTASASPVVGVAVTTSGIVVYATANENIYALSSTASVLFGVAISPNTATLIASGTGIKGGIVFDSTGNLFGVYVAAGELIVIPVNSGTLYGISVTANQPTALYSSGSRWFWDLALDSAENIFISDGWSGSPGVYVLPKITSNLYGQAFTANTFAKVTALGDGTRYAGIDIDSTDTIFVNAYYNSTYVLSSTTENVFETTVNANSATEIVATNPYVDQGLRLTSGGDLIIGGRSSTVRVRDVALLAQTITFPAISDAVVGSTNTSANATASSGTNVVYRSNSNSVCTIFEGYWNTPGPMPITLLTVGTCSITASEEGDATYAPAADVTRTFNVTAAVNNNVAAETIRIAAEAAAAKKAKEQRELIEILSLIPELGRLSLNIGDTALAVSGQKCIKDKTIKYVKKGAKCPKGYVKRK